MNANHIFTINLDEDELAEALSNTFDEYVKVDDLSQEVRGVLDDTDFCDEDGVRDICRDEHSDLEYNILHGDDLEKVIENIIDKRIEAAIHESARSILMAALVSLKVPSLVPHIEG